MRKHRRSRGITLVETGIVVAVSAIALTAAAPSLRSTIESRRLDGVAAQLAGDIRFARSEAVARGETVRVSIRQQSFGDCYVLHTGSTSDCNCEEAAPARCTGRAKQIKTVVLPSSDGIALSANVGSVAFDSAYGTSSPAGTLKVSTASGRAIAHVINIMGRVRSCTPAGSAAVAGYRAC